jgi:hypothetical protein
VSLLTEMKFKARIQSEHSSVLDNVLCSLESTLSVVLGRSRSRDAWFRNARVFPISHEDRDLGAELGKFERALSLVSYSYCAISRGTLHATSEMMDPAVAPAAPKQAAVANVG